MPYFCVCSLGIVIGSFHGRGALGSDVNSFLRSRVDVNTYLEPTTRNMRKAFRYYRGRHRFIHIVVLHIHS